MSITDSDISLSIVNLVLFQSHDAPKYLNCFKIIPPCFSFQSHTYFRNSVLERSFFSIPFFCNALTTLFSVAIDA